ncbi:MAG: class I SAM-dependent methyltransferase [Patescibacteria group bacterium]|nr:methyltransferase domain-containing protein [Patescibacteria group bacterium]MDE1941278.1 class I SAM-dependent methyltransferase [Patescibacteria group bacterium]MDE1966816.1 class I SAM-dependent methyltransferase [Patescibacteria group bacterium]
MNVPFQAIPFILYQRTGLSSIYKIPKTLRPLFDWLTKPPVYKMYVNLDSFFRAKAISKDFSKGIEQEYNEIQPYLPPTAKKILDIGCGVGGIDALLAQRYPDAEIFLFDETTTDKKIHYGFEKKGSFYNSLDVAKDLVEKNGGHHVTSWPVSRGFPKEKFDLVVSIMSWGAHYPVDTYLDDVYEGLNPGGIVITDLRNGTDGLDLFKSRFRSVMIISENRKSRKIAATK